MDKKCSKKILDKAILLKKSIDIVVSTYQDQVHFEICQFYFSHVKKNLVFPFKAIIKNYIFTIGWYL